MNFCLEDFTGESLSFCLSEIDKLDTLLNIKSVKIPVGEGTHKTLHLADKLFAIDGCWRKESLFSSGMWSVGCLGSSEWHCTHEQAESTNWTWWVQIRERGVIRHTQVVAGERNQSE